MLDEGTCFVAGLDESTMHAVRKVCATAGITVGVLHPLHHALQRLDNSAGSCCLLDMQRVGSMAPLMLREITWEPLIGIDFSTRKRSTREVVASATSFGLCDYLSMPEDQEHLGNAITAALSLDARGPFAPLELRRRCSLLTAREKQIIHLFLQGDNTKVHAKSLGITYQTVDKHRGRALRKLGVQSVAELARHIQLTCLTSRGSLLPAHVTPGQVPKPHISLNAAAFQSTYPASHLAAGES